MYKVLNDPEIPCNAGIAIEYNIPQTSKRIDFLISGLNQEKKSHVVMQAWKTEDGKVLKEALSK